MGLTVIFCYGSKIEMEKGSRGDTVVLWAYVTVWGTCTACLSAGLGTGSCTCESASCKASWEAGPDGSSTRDLATHMGDVVRVSNLVIVGSYA